MGNPKSYKLPVVFAILVHLLAALVLVSQWPDYAQKRRPPIPTFISASIVREHNQVLKKASKKKTTKDKKNAQKRKLQEKKRQEAKRKAAAKKKRLAKEQAKKRALQKKIAAQKRAKAKQKAAKAKAEKQRRDWEQELLEKIAIEEAEQVLQQQAADALEAERQATVTNDFSSQIKQHVTGMWNYPHGVDAKLEVEVRVTLVPTGEVVRVVILKSSGQAALDKSVEQAIYAASPLPVPKDSLVFENQFRNFIMKFRPEDAVL